MGHLKLGDLQCDEWRGLGSKSHGDSPYTIMEKSILWQELADAMLAERSKSDE